MDDWQLSEYRPDGSEEVWYFRKNLAPAVTPGDAAFPFLAFLTFLFEPRDASGLPRSEVSAELAELEESEFHALESAGIAVQVGAVLKPGLKDLVFYVSRPSDFEARVKTLAVTFPQYRVSCEISRDEAWSQYHDLP